MNAFNKRPDLPRLKATNLTPEERRQIGGEVSLLGEAKIANRRMLKTLWVSGFAMCFAGGGACLGAYYLVKLLPREDRNHYIEVDRSTGWIGTVLGATDVPKTFDERVDEYWINQYVRLAYEYTWQTDHTHYDLVQQMSGADQFERWKDQVHDPLADQLKQHGSAQISPQGVIVARQKDGDANVREYTIQFDYQVTDRGNVGPWMHYTGDIQFAWHPEIKRNEIQVRNNPGGMYVISLSANKDAHR